MIFPQAGETWRHYQGDDYRIVGFGYDEETGRPNIHYRRDELDEAVIWVRDVGDFLAWLHTGVADYQPRFVKAR